MLNALNHLTLAVSNLPASIAFWRDLLGLRLHAEWHTGAYLTCGDLWLCLSYDETRTSWSCTWGIWRRVGRSLTRGWYLRQKMGNSHAQVVTVSLCETFPATLL